jgi:formylglycine-generating enzyme required for sulfatase activity
MTTTPVKSLSTCEGGVPGLFDMSGNVAEWENVCEGSACAIVGGSYGSTATGSTCSTWFSGDRVKPLPNVGIRCCDDP